ncbi:Putative uncharacterized protein [Taphrina deformans PYCC 5710]|uniref:E3 ubiquitin-protein ligase listerin n=1 Tax=Taphrina deformans (strain PYCC 5710 / ATCC 11124 / CBS 356.35 / IMI 108563 / JCM 9778 / NBRC 8474) TaxID=1097556 RepID=R4X8N5_TAPDE|nr:Putative uncharacterized protein [Taphrina deformans PYCC 5710]|eukprot:CCG81740.1 Putative uncharacterized protein [Taphrina deformans PYCC 5710]
MVTPSKNQSGQFAFGAPGALSNSFGTPVHNVSALEPDLQVIFKGLQKRDATTRVKAVEDLVQNSGKLLEDLPEASVDPFVGAFMGLYPTLAIDVDRKVRANVHAIVGMLVRAYKKRTVRQLADCAPYWQLGLHDSDRTVSKAAADALTMAFPTSEKQTEFKKLFSVATVGRCIELALDEDASSLSDSRFRY